MTSLRNLLTALFVLFAASLFAQTSLPIALDLQKTYIKGTRTRTGEPGKKYWQNHADYLIKVNFDPQSRLLSGTVDIDYFNNSPDTLKTILFKLYPNLYKKGFSRNSTIAAEDESDGVQIQSISINQQSQDMKKVHTDGTNMSVKVTPIAPSQKAHLTVAYSYTLNKGSHTRTGQVDSGAFFIAYFFPRVAVYDDIDGWNRYQYRGSEEFYNDFCHFNAEITVPGNYAVWSTGMLKNAPEVFNPHIISQLSKAGNTDGVTEIITPEDLKSGITTTPGRVHTWKFEADSVTDLAIATSNHYIWQSSSLVVDPATRRRTRVDAVFNPDHKTYYNVISYARKTVETMSYTFPAWPYPYPHETVFDGLDQMEYPMMVNDNPLEKTDEDIELTDHEIFHTMFPFYMGINETKYGWMDEGWATIGEWVISPVIDHSIVDYYGMDAYNRSAGNEDDQPIMTLTPNLGGISAFTDSYPKPAMGYYYVRDMLGKELFTKALHYYIKNWHGKHPMPYDFFNCMNTGSGINMNWFWKAWYFDDGIPDQAISKVSNAAGKYTVIITNIGTKPVPVDLTVYYKDGSTEKLHKSIIVWKDGAKTCKMEFTAKKTVAKMVLGSTYDPDINKTDNVWGVK